MQVSVSCTQGAGDNVLGTQPTNALLEACICAVRACAVFQVRFLTKLLRDRHACGGSILDVLLKIAFQDMQVFVESVALGVPSRNFSEA
jgi:hypothetical protein